MSDLSEKWKERHEWFEVKGNWKDETKAKKLPPLPVSVNTLDRTGKKMTVPLPGPETWVNEVVPAKLPLPKKGKDR